MVEHSDSRLPRDQSGIWSRLEITGIALSLVAGLLYVHGIAFYRAYLFSFGLGIDSFPLSVDQVMMRGFEAYILLASRGGRFLAVSSGVTMGIFVAVFVVAFIADWLLQRSWTRRFTHWATPWLFYDPLEAPRRQLFMDVTFRAFVYFVVSIIVFLVLVITAAFAADSGRNKADMVRDACKRNAQLSNIQPAELAWGTVAVRVVVEYEQSGNAAPTHLSGCLVATAPELIALFTDSGTTIIPQSRVVTIKSKGP